MGMGEWKAHVIMGMLFALAIILISAYVTPVPTLYAELFVLLGAVVASSYFGRRAIGVVLLAYAVPVGIVLFLQEATILEWLLLLLKTSFIFLASYVAGEVIEHFTSELARMRLKMTRLQGELRFLRRLMQANEKIMRQDDADKIMETTAQFALDIAGGTGAGIWFASGGHLEAKVSIDWPVQISTKNVLEHLHLGHSDYHDGEYHVLMAGFSFSDDRGMLAIERKGPQVRCQSSLRALNSFANVLSVALANSRALESLRVSADYLTLLNELGRRFATNLGLEDLFSSMYREVRQVMDAEAFFVGLFNSTAGEIDLRYIYDRGKRVPPMKYLLNDGPTSRAIKSRLPVQYSTDARLIPGVTMLGDPSSVVQSVLVVPIIFDDKVIGALSAQSYNSNAYSDEHVRLLSIIASQAGMAIDNAQLYEKTLSMAMTDGMTGLANARSLHQALEAMLQQGRTYGREVSLLLLDSDCLKTINDQYGHLAGDDHILSLAEAMKACVRTGDLVARYGGDEFVIALPNTATDEARRIADRIVVAVRENSYKSGAFSMPITISVGVATYPQDAETVDDLIRAADMAMYSAKQGGKDRVIYVGDVDAKSA